MPTDDLHISDPELLLMADGELSARRAAQVRAHIATCWNCRSRMVELEGAVVDFARAHREAPNVELPSIAGPRALLSVQLAELASKPGTRRLRWFGSLPSAMHTTAICAAVCGIVVIGTVVFRYATVRSSEADVLSLEHGVVPNSHLTPGATRPVSLEGLCLSAHEEVVGQVTEPLRRQVLDEYGIVDARADGYEIDYLITPGLGGVEDIRNLWPQPYAALTWNAYAKDVLEERLHQMVCGGELDLTVAQQDIAGDWIAAYKKYVQTNRPRPSNAKLGTPILQAASMTRLAAQ